MLSVVDAAVTYDIDEQHPIFEGRLDLFEYECLIHDRSHREGIITRNEGEIRQGRGADQGRC